MEMQAQTNEKTERHADEGLKPHLWSFVLSLLLTVLAFYAIGKGTVSPAFAVPFVLALGIVQALVQAAVWMMHMRKKGNETAVTFMLSAAVAIIITIFACAALAWW
ncbi:hypothetical protein BSNK01_30990 [Bacillaceae bacterium]